MEEIDLMKTSTVHKILERLVCYNLLNLGTYLFAFFSRTCTARKLSISMLMYVEFRGT